MGLKEALEASQRNRPGYRCGVCKLLDELPADDAEALRSALEDPHVQGAQIARALHAEGIDVSQHSVQRHRRQDCSG
jgi:hypothetical protein